MSVPVRREEAEGSEPLMRVVLDWFRAWKLVSWRSAVVAAVVGYGLVGFFVVPRVVEKLMADIVRERTGREVQVAEVRCNPFTLSLTIRGFAIPDRPGTTLVSFDEFYANAQISSLFRRAATLKAFRLENPSIEIRRFEDGGINIRELLDDWRARSPASDQSEGEIRIPRVLLQDVLASGGFLLIEDHAREEPLLWRHDLARFDLHNISTVPGHRGDHELVLALQRGGSIGVSGEVDVEPLALEGSVAFEGIDLAGTWDALRPYFDFELQDGIVDGTFSYVVRMAEDGPHVLLSDVDLRAGDLEFSAGPAEETILRVASLGTSGISLEWPEARVRGDSIVIGGVEALQWIREDGTPSWDELVPEATQEQVRDIYRRVEEAFPWDLALDRLEIRNSVARVEDRTFPEPLDIVVEDAGAVLTDFATGPDRQWGLTAQATVLGEGVFDAEGFVRTGPMALEMEVALENVQLPRAQPYLERIGPLQLRSGVLEAAGVARILAGGVEPAASFSGDVTVRGVDLDETLLGTSLLGWDRVDARGVEAGLKPFGVGVASVEVLGADVEIVVSEEGEVSVLQVISAIGENRGSVRDSEEGPEEDGGGAGGQEAGPPPIAVDEVILTAASVSVEGRSLDPALTLALDSLGGVIQGIATGGTGGARLDLEGTVESGGWVGVQGEIDLLRPKRATDLEIAVRRLHLPPLSPVSVRLIGHPFEEGDASLSLDYEVVASELTGHNSVVTDGLALGDKVEGEGKVNLPFKLGVSLLTDREGRITLEFPVSGNLDDPQFVLSNAVGSAATEVVSQVIESPFRLLGRVAGTSGEGDLGFVEFAAGSSQLAGASVEGLDQLAAAARERPAVALVVRGAWEPELDGARLRELAVEERLGGQPATVAALETLARESIGVERLDSLRAAHRVPDPGTGEVRLDETGYRRSLRATLVEAQPLDPEELRSLAVARAESIRAFLVGDGGLSPARVRIAEPAPTEASTPGRWVRVRLDVEPAG